MPWPLRGRTPSLGRGVAFGIAGRPDSVVPVRLTRRSTAIAAAPTTGAAGAAGHAAFMLPEMVAVHAASTPGLTA